MMLASKIHNGVINSDESHVGFKYPDNIQNSVVKRSKSVVTNNKENVEVRLNLYHIYCLKPSF